MTKDQRIKLERNLGRDIVGVMSDMLSASKELPEGFSVEEGTLAVDLSPALGEFAGGWTFTIERK